MSRLACPECGQQTNFTQVRKRWFCDCQNCDCKSCDTGMGRTREEAHDDYMERCELKGHTTHLTNVLRDLCHRSAPA